MEVKMAVSANRALGAIGVLMGLIVACVVFGTATGVEKPAAPKSAPPAPDAALAGLRVSGPHVHQNLAVYLLHRDERDDRNFLTLNEGLEKKLVKVTELENEQVAKLTIENLSDDPLFLQEGDRVTGGKQDRTIYTSLVIAPKSGPQEIPTFCVEQSRWEEGATGKAFMHNKNIGYASNGVRAASKLLKNQGIVWDNVAQTKGRLMRSIGNRDTTSSLNEAQDSEQVTKSTQAFIKSLGGAAGKHKDIVGMAFAVSGKLQEVNIYPGCPLTQRVYPRLLETYALDAVMQASEDKEAAKAKAPTAEQVLALMKTNVQAKAQREEKINEDNGLCIFGAEKADEKGKLRLYRCATEFKGQTVHLQWIQGPASLEAPAKNVQRVVPLPRNSHGNRQVQEQEREQER
jgi:hypothetical protein